MGIVVRISQLGNLLCIALILMRINVSYIIPTMF